MFYINYFKGEPGEYIYLFKNGKIVREGRGISFFFINLSATVVVVPVKTIDAGFIFNEVTKNFQNVTVQGQITYRIAAAEKIWPILDFSVDPKTRAYVSEDPAKLLQRIIDAAQAATRAEIRRNALEEAIKNSEAIAGAVFDAMKKHPALEAMGVECLRVHFSSILPTPEMSKALEAEYRELLQRKADEAIYSRRAAAVEQERKIRENELGSEVALEKGKRELVELAGANSLREAEFRSKALEMELAPYRTVDPKILLSQGLRSLGENASKIGNLTITPDLLSAILNGGARADNDVRKDNNNN